MHVHCMQYQWRYLMKRLFSSFRRKNRDNDFNEHYVPTERDDRKHRPAEDEWFWWPLILPSSFD